MIEDDNFITTEEEKTEYIDDAIIDLCSLRELLDMFENVLLNDEELENDHMKAAWLTNNLKKAAVESMEKSLLDINFSDDLKN